MQCNSQFVEDEHLDSLLADFLDEAMQLLDRLSEDMLALDECVSSHHGANARCDDALMNRMFRSAHSIKGLSAMLGLQSINSLTHKIENVFDAARTGELRFDRRAMEVLFRSVDGLAAMVTQLSDAGHDEYDVAAIVAEIQGLLDGATPRHAAAARSPVSQPPKNLTANGAVRPSETIRVEIERLDQLMNLADQLIDNKARLFQIGDALQGLLPTEQSQQAIAEIGRIAGAVEAAVDRYGAKNPASVDLESIRADVRKLQGAAAVLQQESARVLQARRCIVNLLKAAQQLELVSDRIQKSVVGARMVPIGPLFGRFKRVVRDITHASGKEIQLLVRGETTQLDKRLIDELGEPLIHMVRNSADHGIELPEAREAGGKPRQGAITLNAEYRGNSIIIEVRDDGAGLDRDRILAKALEKELVTPAEAGKMTDHQVYQLIWEPGFTTAEKVTDISGRGMGMDIVRSKIEELGGVVAVESRPGAGALFRIELLNTLDKFAT